MKRGVRAEKTRGKLEGKVSSDLLILVRAASHPWQGVQFLPPGSPWFGFSPRQLLHRADRLQTLLHPDDLARVPRVLKQALNRGRAAWSFRVRHADGRYRWWHEEVRPLPSRNGDGAKLISCLARMTGRVPTPQLRARVRARLEGFLLAAGPDVAAPPPRSEAHWPLLVEHSPVAMMLVKRTGEIICSNPALRRYHGERLAGARTMAAFVEAAHTDRAVRARLLKYWRDEVVARASGRREPAVFRSPVEGVGGMHEIVFHWVMSGGMVVVTLEDLTQFRRVEQALRNSQERLSYALHGANDGIWDWNLATDAVYYSPRWKQMLGYADHEVENHLSAWSRLVHPEDREAVLKQAAAFMAGLTARYEVEFRMRHKAGHWVDILARATMIRDAQGRPVRLVGTHVDITARREAERQLRAMQAQLEQRVQERTAELQAARTRLETLLQAAPAGIVIHDANGRILQANATAGKLLGLAGGGAPGKVLADPAWRLLREDGTPMPQSGFPAAQVLAARQGLTGQICGILNGRQPEPVWVYVNAEPCFDARGELAEVVVSFMDITARLSAERSRDEERHLLRNLIDTCADIVFLKDARLRTVLCNQAFAAVLGKQPADVYGKTDRENGWPPELVTTFEQEDLAVLRGGTIRNSCDQVSIAGEIRSFETIKVPFRNAAGEIIGVLGIARDITDRQQMETALRESEERLRLALQASNAGVWAWDPLTGAVYWDACMSQIYGCAPNEQPSFDTWIGCMHPEDRPGMLKRVEEFLQPDSPNDWDVEFRVLHPNMGERWINGLARAARDGQGRLVSLVGINLDITDRKRVIEALRLSEERLRLALAAAKQSCFDLNLQTRECWVSPEYATLLGLAPQEFRESVQDRMARVHPDDRASVLQAFDDCLAGRVPEYVAEFRERIPNGSWVWVLSRGVIVTRTPDGHPLRMLGTRTDITERKRVELALQESEQRLRLALAAANQGFYDLNVQTGDCVVSPEYATMLGYDPAVFRETNAAWIERLHPDDRESVAKIYQDYVAGLRPLYAVEFRQRTQDGGWKWILSFGKIVSYTAEGRPLRMLGTHTDITERKQTEAAVRESEAKYRRLIETMRDAFVCVDMSGRILEFNSSYEAMLGYSAAELGQKTYVELTPERWHAHEARIIQEEVLTQGFSGVYEKEYRRADGTVFPVELSTVLIRDAAGEPARMWAVIRDITQRKQAETELRASEAKYRTLIECLWDAYATVDLHGNILQVNSTLAAMVGYSEAELRQMAFWEFTPPQWHAAEEKILREQVLSRGYSDIYEKEYRHKNGSVIPVELRVYLVRNSAGEPVAMWGIIRDITARKQNEAALRDLNANLEQLVAQRTESLRLSEQRFRTLAEATFEGVILSRQGRILDCNEQLATILACPRDQLIGRMWPDFVAEGMRDRVQSAILAGTEAHFEHELIRPDGAWCMVETHGRSPDGPDGVRVTSVRDITERKLAEVALRESEARFRQLAEATFEGIVISVAGKIQDCNTQFARLFGYEPAEVVGCTVAELVTPENRALVAANIRSGFDEPYEFTGLRKDGSTFPAEAHARMRAEGGRIIRVTAVRDLTAVREAAAAFERQRVELARAQRLADLSEVSAGVIHQIGQPLTAAINNISAAKTLVTRCSNQQCQAGAFFLDADASLKRVQITMSRLRALAHPERVRRELRDLNLLVAEVVHLLTPEAGPLGVQVRLDLQPDLPPASVDEVQLGQALLNLLRNACDAVTSCEPGRRQVTVITRQDDHAHLRIEVSDQGTGIPPSVLPRLFEPFFTTKPNGTGVGLRLCRTIVTAHGGTLTARNNEPGPGATFEITLPILTGGTP